MDSTSPPANALPPRPGWWSRNWKWFVPAGCLGLPTLVVVFAASILMFVFGLMKSTDVYKTAVARAKSNPEVVQALGSPMHEGMFLSGNTHVNGASGTADLAIPISGPKGKGTIYVVATKSAGEWTYSRLEVEITATEKRITLEP